MTYTVAQINEDKCIGCMLCITACPFDAIIGSSKQLHTVLTQACTGCELCLPPCPTSCIDFVPLELKHDTKNKAHHEIYKTRVKAKKNREAKNKENTLQQHHSLTQTLSIQQKLAHILKSEAK